MRISRRRFIQSGLLLATGAMLTEAFWVEKFFIEIKAFYLGAANKESRNIKVVQVSDLHLRSLNYQLRQLTDRINHLQPDLIVFTGDAVDDGKNLGLLDQLLSRLDTNIKKVAITGNWEYWGKVNLGELAEIYTRHNGTLLLNRSAQFFFGGKTVSITGVDDFLGGNADFATAIKSYTPSDYHIILNHCPQYSEAISAQMRPEIQADCILSGHTHGGQINLFGYAPFLPPGSGKYVKGWYEHLSHRMYVSKGIGTSVLPVRFGSRAEIAVFQLLA